MITEIWCHQGDAKSSPRKKSSVIMQLGYVVRHYFPTHRPLGHHAHHALSGIVPGSFKVLAVFREEGYTT